MNGTPSLPALLVHPTRKATLCIDCAHISVHDDSSEASCNADRAPVSTVTGKPVMSCAQMRHLQGFCGPEAAWFSPRPPREHAAYSREVPA